MKASSLVLHSTPAAGGRSLMAPDFPPGPTGTPQQAVTVSHEAGSDAEARRIFAALAEGGTLIMDYRPSGPTASGC